MDTPRLLAVVREQNYSQPYSRNLPSFRDLAVIQNVRATRQVEAITKIPEIFTQKEEETSANCQRWQQHDITPVLDNNNNKHKRHTLAFSSDVVRLWASYVVAVTVAADFPGQ